MAEIGNSNLFQAGILNTKDAFFVIARTEWNADIVDELERGCVRKLRDCGAAEIEVVTVPGAFELAFGIRSYWEANQNRKAPQAFIALGCVLRGETPHFDYICKAATDGLVQLNLTLPVPVIYGVLTVDNLQQALDRIGGKHGHKGEEAAVTAVKMVNLRKSFNTRQST